MRQFVILLVSFSLLACAGSQTTSNIVGDTSYDPKSNDYIMATFLSPDVVGEGKTPTSEFLTKFGGPFSMSSEIGRDYIVIGKVRTVGAPVASERRLMEDTKERARQLGADAMIITKMGYRKRSDGMPQPWIYADAIRYSK